MIKKLGIIKLPPPFWMQDPKINPPAEQLFWAALLLKDRSRIDQALSVLSIEQEEKIVKKGTEFSQNIDHRARELVSEFLEFFKDTQVRKQYEEDLCNLVPEWLTCNREEVNE